MANGKGRCGPLSCLAEASKRADRSQRKRFKFEKVPAAVTRLRGSDTM